MPFPGCNSRFNSLNWPRLTSGPSTEKRSRCRKLITLRSRAAVPIYPATVVTSNESSAATLHFAEGVARTTEFAWAIVAIALWNSVDGGRESEEDSEQSLHGVLVFDSGFGTREVGS